jgi:hypothetical protein
MLPMYLCVRSIDVGNVCLCEVFRCWSYICVLGVSMLFGYLCVRSIDVGHVFICEGYRRWLCIGVLGV